MIDFEKLGVHLASQSGDVAALNKLVADGEDPNLPDCRGNTPLKYAAAEAQILTVNRLLELDVDINFADNRGFTPLHCAAAHGFLEDSLEVVRALLLQGARADVISTKMSYTVLHEARSVPILDLLLQQGAPIAHVDSDGLTAAERQRENGHYEEASFLFERA